jgi:hypothetical protein
MKYIAFLIGYILVWPMVLLGLLLMAAILAIIWVLQQEPDEDFVGVAKAAWAFLRHGTIPEK